jgi:hypothetical protein
MLTLFTTAKPFRGHNGVIQRNALKSWTLLDRDVEIILFGEDEGAAEVARELGIHHEPNVERNEFGTVRIDSIFAKAEAVARHDLLCYLNCDIILLQDFSRAIPRVKSAYAGFLAIGRRWDVDISEKIDFRDTDWQQKVKEMAVLKNYQQTDWFIDYFIFTRGFFGSEIPPLAVGRIYWDNWMVWKALQTGRPVLDISPAVVAIHQNHDYTHHPLGKRGVYAGEEAELNLRLAGGLNNLRCIGDATHVVGAKGIGRNTRRHWTNFVRAAPWLSSFLQFKLWNPVYFFFLGITRPLRSALGLRSDPMRRLREKI